MKGKQKPSDLCANQVATWPTVQPLSMLVDSSLTGRLGWFHLRWFTVGLQTASLDLVGAIPMVFSIHHVVNHPFTIHHCWLYYGSLWVTWMARIHTVSRNMFISIFNRLFRKLSQELLHHLPMSSIFPYPYAPWCCNIYPHLPWKSPKNVGKYTIHGAFRVDFHPDFPTTFPPCSNRCPPNFPPFATKRTGPAATAPPPTRSPPRFSYSPPSSAAPAAAAPANPSGSSGDVWRWMGKRLVFHSHGGTPKWIIHGWYMVNMWLIYG